MLPFIGASGCELDVWGFRDVNEQFFCPSLLYTPGRFHKTKLASLSMSLIYYFCMEDIVPLLLALLLASSKKPEGRCCSVVKSAQCSSESSLHFLSLLDSDPYLTELLAALPSLPGAFFLEWSSLNTIPILEQNTHFLNIPFDSF